MCQVRVSEQKSRKPRMGEKFQTASIVSEDFNEDQKAVGLPLVPLKHGINLGIDPCVQNFCLSARKWLLTVLWHRLLSQRFRKTKEWIIQSWDRIRVMEIDWPELSGIRTALLIKTETLVVVRIVRKNSISLHRQWVGSKGKEVTVQMFSNNFMIFWLDCAIFWIWNRFSAVWDSVRLCIVLLWCGRYNSTVAFPRNHVVGMEQGLQGPKIGYSKNCFCLKMNFVLWQPFPQSPNDGTNQEPVRSGILRILKKINYSKWYSFCDSRRTVYSGPGKPVFPS